MADYNLSQTGNLSPEDYAQQQALNRQQRFSEMLMQQGQQPQGQMVSGRYVAPSFTQMLQPVANMITAAYMGKQSDTEAAKLAEKIRSGKATKEEAITNLITGTPEKTTELAGPYTGNIPMPTAVTPATKPDLSAALREINTNNPYGAGSEYKAALVGNMIPKKTDKLIEYDTYKAEGGKKSFSDWAKEITPEQQARLDIDRQRLGLEKQKAAFEMQNGKPLNESQGKAAVFHSQMVGASNELNNLYSKGFNPNKPQSQVTTGMAGGAFNFLTPSAAQQAKQAQNQWTEAYLRFKTGAGTNAHEIEANRKTYFPDFGDQPDAIAQKARMREQAQNDIAMAAGPQGARMGVQSNPVMPTSPITPSANTQQATPSLWGQATVVK